MQESGTLASFRPETIAATGAALAALQLAKERSGADDVTYKTTRDIVTGTDIAVEDLIRTRLAPLGIAVVGEERGGESEGGAAYWLVDPICGTRNFASGMTLFCTNIALVENGEVTLAAIGDPSTEEVLLAERGRGAWALKDGTLRRIQASDSSQTVIIEDGTAEGLPREHAARMTAHAILANRWDFRALGTSLSAPYVAAGRASAYVCFYIRRMHAAAGALVASEAGATLTEVDGQPWTVNSESMLAAATPSLHADLLSMTRQTRP